MSPIEQFLLIVTGRRETPLLEIYGITIPYPAGTNKYPPTKNTPVFREKTGGKCLKTGKGICITCDRKDTLLTMENIV
jgi:hypothetical protein